jgi:hypothetical protein
VTALVKRLGWTCVVVSGVPTVVSRMPTVWQSAQENTVLPSKPIYFGH